jgi:hypothetical protein
MEKRVGFTRHFVVPQLSPIVWFRCKYRGCRARRCKCSWELRGDAEDTVDELQLATGSPWATQRTLRIACQGLPRSFLNEPNKVTAIGWRFGDMTLDRFAGRIERYDTGAKRPRQQNVVCFAHCSCNTSLQPTNSRHCTTQPSARMLSSKPVTLNSHRCHRSVGTDDYARRDQLKLDVAVKPGGPIHG